MIRPNVDAEMSVLCCMFVDNSTVAKIMGELDADDFKYIPNRAVFEVCKELFMGGKPIDPVTVGSKYPHTGHLAEIINATPTTANLNYHIQAVADRAKRINAEKTTEELLKLLETEEITECQALVNKLSDTLAGNKRVEMLTMKDAIANFYNPSDTKKLHKYRIYHLRQTHTLIRRFCIGRASAGKTAFTLQLGLNMAKQHKVLYFSLETKPDKLFDRVFSNLAEISLSQIKTGGDAMKIKEWNRYTANVPNMHNLDFTVIKASGMTVQQIKSTALEAKADVVFIDYLSLIRDGGLICSRR